MTRTNSSFISPKTCFDLFVTGGWIEKLNFKENIPKVILYWGVFVLFKRSVNVAQMNEKKTSVLKKCWRISVKLQSQHI